MNLKEPISLILKFQTLEFLQEICLAQTLHLPRSHRPRWPLVFVFLVFLTTVTAIALSFFLWVGDEFLFGGHFGQLDLGLIVAPVAQCPLEGLCPSFSVMDVLEALDDYSLENTFLVLDHNEDGAVSASEAQAHFEHDEVMDFFYLHDTNSDGQLTWAEFSGHSFS